MLIRYVRWTVARARFRWQLHRAERAAWYQGVDIIEMLTESPVVEKPRPPWLTAPTPTQVETCQGCGGRRCRPWREGRDCREQEAGQRPAYAAGQPLPRDGRHSTTVRIAHWARIDRLHQLRDRMGIAPARIVSLP